MLDTGNQRWRERKAFFRRPDEQIDARIHDVAAFDSDNVARDFIATHHYAGTLPPAKFRFGLYERGELVGVAAFTVPQRDEVTRNVFPTLPPDQRVELGRFVLLDRVKGNGETWFLSRCLKLLALENVFGVVSFSDPVPRPTLAGKVVMPGHVGTIYQAANASYL